MAFAAPRRGEGASLTYGHYSKGERVKLRKAIEKLKYAPEVMRLIRGQRAARAALTRDAANVYS